MYPPSEKRETSLTIAIAVVVPRIAEETHEFWEVSKGWQRKLTRLLGEYSSTTTNSKKFMQATYPHSPTEIQLKRMRTCLQKLPRAAVLPLIDMVMEQDEKHQGPLLTQIIGSLSNEYLERRGLL